MTESTSKSCKPWLDQNGEVLHDDILREISKNWTTNIWESFLSETVDRSQTEKLVSPKAYQAIVEEMIEPVWVDLDEADPLDTKVRAQVRRAMRSYLTHQQQIIIRLIYWEDQSNREIAKSMGVTETQVRVQKRRSLNKLEDLLERHISFFPCVKGKNDFQGSPEGKILLAVDAQSTHPKSAKGL